jgi:streptogramin lyase
VLKTVTVPANSTTPVTVTVTPPDDAFSLWVGDPGLGDQTGMAVALDRGPRTESLSLGEPFSAPLHQALDQDGAMWVTISGLDALERFTPQDDLSSAHVERFPLPGGSTDPNALFFEPTDVAVDGHGTVWSTLALGNGIARLDRTQARDGTSAGIRIYSLEPCTDTICRRPPPPPEPGPLSRLPLQMKVTEDGSGNTLVWFTEQLADRIGLLRIAPDGTKLNEVHYPCGCTDPLGLDLDAQGNVWFTENRNNRIGRLAVDPTRPYNASAVDIQHFDIPSGAPEFDIGLPLCPAPGQTSCTPPGIPNPVISSAPHSLSIDREGRVWFSEELTRKMAYLDPTVAKPGTTDGIHEFDLDTNDFNRTPAPADMVIDRAGTVHYSDEYGDIIGRIRADGTQPRGFRPLERQSLTDSPVTDPAGNLWFIESGSSMVTRISGVTAGLPLPAAAPLLTADIGAGRLTASGLREMTSVDVRVVRGAAVAGSATGVPLVNGGFSVDLPLRGDDRVEIVPHGPNARAPFWFRVADLSATVDAGGLVTGTARSLGQALPERVQIAAGSDSGAPAISADDGSFSWIGPAGAAGGGTLSFTGATPMARFRTVTPFSAFAPPPATGGGTSGAPGGGAPGAGVPGGGGAPTPAPAGPPATPAPQPRPPAARPRPAPPAAAPACARPPWLARARSRRTVPLLGMTRSGVQRCFGAPARRSRHGKDETWTYGRTLTLRLRGGRVVSFTVRDRTLRSRPDRAAVGGRVARFRRALGRLAADGRRGQRGLVRVGGGYADVRLAVRSGRVQRIAVTRVSRRALDRTGRALARGLR